MSPTSALSSRNKAENKTLSRLNRSDMSTNRPMYDKIMFANNHNNRGMQPSVSSNS
jgi:hypothetical protein